MRCDRSHSALREPPSGRAKLLALAAVLSLAALAGCSKPSYSPLDPQLSWQYAVTVEPRDRSGAVTKT